MKLPYLLIAVFFLSGSQLFAQGAEMTLEELRAQVNYDESKVPEYTLPPLLGSGSDARLVDINQWTREKRPQLIELMEEEMYGVFPDHGIRVSYITNSDKVVMDGKARRKEVSINVSNGSVSRDVSMLIYIPNRASAAVPIFLGLNFYGNHTIYNDPEITIHRSWVRDNEEFGIKSNMADSKSRGVRSHRWPVEQILENGFGLATIYYGEIDPDYDDNFENGIHSLLPPDTDKTALSSLSAWAWMLSQTLDYFEQDQSIDHEHVAVIGHSRLGKAALWAGAKDQRFAMVVSNDSGCGGAALSRRQFGETVHIINTAFPHWFSDRFADYNQEVNELPFDQHSLLAAIAPRPLYVASASEDQWADPRGEFTAAQSASLVYNLFDKKGLENVKMPDVNQPVGDGEVGYHIREGKHDITSYDWQQYLTFAKRHFKE